MAFPNLHPKLNRYSFAVEDRCVGKLLHHQHKALKQLQNWFSRDNPDIAVVSMPTGSGKTGVMCCLPYFLGSIDMQRSQDPSVNFPTGNPRYSFDKPILVIAPNNAIAKQHAGQMLLESLDALHESFLVVKTGIVPEQNAKDALPSGVKIEGTGQLTNPGKLIKQDIIIADVHKFLSKKKAPVESQSWVEVLPEDLFRLVIVDEAHHVPAQTWDRIIKKFSGHALVVFFTATPYRGDGKKVAKEEYFKYHLSLKDAREGGIIRRTKWVPIETSYSSDEDVFSVVLEKVKEIQERKNTDTPLPNNVPHMAIAITKTIDGAERVEKLWNDRFGPDTALAYHSDLTTDEEEKMMKRIRSNRVQLVVIVAKLLEGFDHPPISIAAILTTIRSPVKFAQFIGRAQRIVRLPGGRQESNAIEAHIVSHRYHDQWENFKRFESEKFILINEKKTKQAMNSGFCICELK